MITAIKIKPTSKTAPPFEELGLELDLELEELPEMGIANAEVEELVLRASPSKVPLAPPPPDDPPPPLNSDELEEDALMFENPVPLLPNEKLVKDV